MLKNQKFKNLGVGLNVDFEKKVNKLYPQCDFLGTDPDGERSKKLYKSINNASKFVVGTINGWTGNFKNFIIKNQCMFFCM